MAENNKKDSFNFPPVGGKNNKGPKFGGYWSFIIKLANISKDYNKKFCHGSNEMGNLSRHCVST